MRIDLKEVKIENFKGIKDLTVIFSEKSAIKGKNGLGKSTIVDSVMWLLFGKNSQYVEKFDIRPLDENGKQIDYVDIKVTALFDVDGKEIELQKIQKQNWVKKHGTENPVFQGNVNSYSVDGYSKSEKEYKEVVAGLVSEDLFKILTNPIYFPNMKWKEQRDIIMKFATTESDVEFAKRVGGYDELLGELEKAPSTDDIVKKYTKSKKELDAKLKELPIRIDELSKQKVDIDLAELELQKKSLESQRKASVDVEKLKKDYMDTSFELSKYEQTFHANYRAENDSFLCTCSQKKLELENAEKNIASAERNIASADSTIATLEKQRADLGENYNKIKDMAFDESLYEFDETKAICKACGQKLPDENIERMKSHAKARRDEDYNAFIKRKKDRMDEIVKRGWEIKNRIDEVKLNATNDKSAIEELKLSRDKIKSEITELENNAPAARNIKDDPKYIELWNKTTELKAAIDKAESESIEIAMANSAIDCEIREIETRISKALNNDAINERIATLTTEQRETSQLIANCEKILYLLENFMKAKLDAISVSVNSKFKLVNFKLFDVAINGGVSECCECTVNGVPYSSLNHSMQIIAGLDIIETLAEYYDKIPFVFIDNAECINRFNLPETNGQLIALYVSDDKELIIE